MDYSSEDWQVYPESRTVETVKNWSSAQLSIFSAVESTSDNILVCAGPGSGKTTTIVEAAKRCAGSPLMSKSLLNLNNRKVVRVVSFNKHIAEELKRRLPSNVESTTMHSLGYAELRRVLPSVKVDINKLDKLAKRAIGDPWKETDTKEKKRKLALLESLKQMVSISKACAFNPYEQSEASGIVEACNSYNIEIADGSLVPIAYNLLAQCALPSESVDFDDMLWLPVVLAKLTMSKTDVCFVDEAQDLNQTQIAFLQKMSCRIIAVGDEFQSLYAFRGAAPDSMQQLERTLTCKRMPLNVSYRCPRSVVELAQTINPDVQACEGAPMGSVNYLEEHQFEPRENDMVLCRFNAPLVLACLKLLRKRIRATIRGRDIGKEIAKFAKKYTSNCSDFSSLRKLLKEHFDAEQSKAHTKQYMLALGDKIEVVLTIAADTPVDRVPDEIESLFSDEHSPIVLSTIHRAKGLEASTVWLLDRKVERENSSEWEEQQERNCLFVAYTRAKQTLNIVKEKE